MFLLDTVTSWFSRTAIGNNNPASFSALVK